VLLTSSGDSGTAGRPAAARVSQATSFEACTGILLEACTGIRLEVCLGILLEACSGIRDDPRGNSPPPLRLALAGEGVATGAGRRNDEADRDFSLRFLAFFRELDFPRLRSIRAWLLDGEARQFGVNFPSLEFALLILAILSFAAQFVQNVRTLVTTLTGTTTTGKTFPTGKTWEDAQLLGSVLSSVDRLSHWWSHSDFYTP
ncbi:unnamed protein product, partial [Darwinula stevensoni]